MPFVPISTNDEEVQPLVQGILPNQSMLVGNNEDHKERETFAPNGQIPLNSEYLKRFQESEDYIILGKRGNIDQILGAYMGSRPGCISILRGALATLIGATGIGACYLMSKHHLVPDGYIGLSSNNGHPEVIPPGRHLLLSPLNVDYELIPLTQTKISKGPLHIITVPEEQIGLAMEQGKPLLLGAGVHVIESPFFEFSAFKHKYDQVIAHGTFHRVIVQEGTIGLAWEGNVPVLLPPGIFQINSALFKFVKAEVIDQQEVALEPYYIITVHDGQVGISYDRGVLRILNPGEHWLNRQANQKFLDFLPTTQQVRELKTLDVLTSDGLMVRIKGSVTFRIQNPQLAVINIGSDSEDGSAIGMGVQRHSNITSNIFSTIMRRANDTLASLLTGTEVLSSAGLGMASATVSSTKGGEPGAHRNLEDLTNAQDRDVMSGRNEPQRTKELNSVISHRFKASLTDTLETEWGVELGEMNVVDIQVMDKSVCAALADGVRANIEAVTDRRNAEAKADTIVIMAKGKSDAMKLQTDAEVYNVIEIAQGQQEAGMLLETSPTAVDIRLVEAVTTALSKGSNSLVLARDASAHTLLQLVGASSKIHSMNQQKAVNGSAASGGSNQDRTQVEGTHSKTFAISASASSSDTTQRGTMRTNLKTRTNVKTPPARQPLDVSSVKPELKVDN